MSEQRIDFKQLSEIVFRMPLKTKKKGNDFLILVGCLFIAL